MNPTSRCGPRTDRAGYSVLRRHSTREAEQCCPPDRIGSTSECRRARERTNTQHPFTRDQGELLGASASVGVGGDAVVILASLFYRIDVYDRSVQIAQVVQ